MIKPLIEMKNIPMSVEYKVNNAHYEVVNNDEPFEIIQNDSVPEKRKKPEFVPGNIEVIIKEYPRIEITYIGDPIYVPPSADPNYKPIDTMI